MTFISSMPPIPPQNVPLPTHFGAFNGAAPIISNRTHSVSSDSDSWSHNGVGYPSHVYGNQSSAPVSYHQNAQRTFPPARDYGTNDISISPQSSGRSAELEHHAKYGGFSAPSGSHGRFQDPSDRMLMSPAGANQPAPFYPEWDHPGYMTPENLRRDYDASYPVEPADYLVESNTRRGADKPKAHARYHSSKRASNRDEFDGPHQLLDPPSDRIIAAQERELPHLPTNLDVSEQDQILTAVNARLSQCAFDFVAKYQFPIPIEQDKRQVRVPSDREWNEWVFLLKRLATKRRIPARVLYNNQIKQLVTVLENSLEMRHAAMHQSRPVKDDRNILQLISAGTQVAKILKDASAMDFLDRLYGDTEKRIQECRSRRTSFMRP